MDIDRIRDHKERGYLDVKISEEDIDLQYPKPGKLLVSFNVDEGQQYSVGELVFPETYFYCRGDPI